MKILGIFCGMAFIVCLAGFNLQMNQRQQSAFSEKWPKSTAGLTVRKLIAESHLLRKLIPLMGVGEFIYADIVTTFLKKTCVHPFEGELNVLIRTSFKAVLSENKIKGAFFKILPASEYYRYMNMFEYRDAYHWIGLRHTLRCAMYRGCRDLLFFNGWFLGLLLG